MPIKEVQIASLLGFGLLAAMGLVANPALAEEPSPIVFQQHYGDLSFPAKYPEGTKLTITQWSHFVPAYDKWFDAYAKGWGEKHNVAVKVQHINLTELSATLSASIAAKSGPDLFEMIDAPAAFVEGLRPLKDVNEAAKQVLGEQLDACTHQSYLPKKDIWYGFCTGWTPNPADYRVSLWKDAGYPEGPKSYKDLMEGGVKIFNDTGIPTGLSLSPVLDSELSTRSIIWSFGGQVFDECGNVTLNSKAVVDAVKYQADLYKKSSTPAVFSWDGAGNNQAFISGQASYIQNSISFYRSAQQGNPEITKDTGFQAGLTGPGGKTRMAALEWYVYVIPKYVKSSDTVQAAKNFMLDLTANYSAVTYNSKVYNLPAYVKAVPQLYGDGGWVDHDPFGSEPADKLNVLRHAADWAGWAGWPGYANPAANEIYNGHLIVTMVADAARGVKTAEQSVADTAAQVQKIAEKWKRQGFMGCRADSK